MKVKVESWKSGKNEAGNYYHCQTGGDIEKNGEELSDKTNEIVIRVTDFIPLQKHSKCPACGTVI